MVAIRHYGQEELGKEDMIFFKDGQRAGIHGMAAKQLVKSDNTKMRVALSQFSIVYTSESYLARRERIKSFIQNTEALLVWTGISGLKLKKADRVHFEGSNFVLSLGPVILPPIGDGWLESAEQCLVLTGAMSGFTFSIDFFI